MCNLHLEVALQEGLGLHFLFQSKKFGRRGKKKATWWKLFWVLADTVRFRDLVQVLPASRIGVNGNIDDFVHLYVKPAGCQTRQVSR